MNSYQLSLAEKYREELRAVRDKFQDIAMIAQLEIRKLAEMSPGMPEDELVNRLDKVVCLVYVDSISHMLRQQIETEVLRVWDEAVKRDFAAAEQCRGMMAL